METKCPECGAPMEDGKCGYCGYEEEKPVSAPQPAAQQAPQPQYATPQPQPQYAPPQQQAQYTQQPQVVINNIGMAGVSRKSKTTALLLCIFFGEFGFHKFYVGKTGMGILYMLTLGLLGIGWLVDIIVIASGSFKDKFGLPLKQ